MQIQSPLSQSYLMSSESTIYYFDIEFHKYNNNKKERKEGGTSGWKTRKETLRNDKNEAGGKKKKRQRGKQNASLCLLAV